MDHIPIHRLYEEAERAVENGDDPESSLDDQVIIRLLHWFKHDFFTWVNDPPCDYCGVRISSSPPPCHSFFNCIIRVCIVVVRQNGATRNSRAQ